MRYAVSQIRVMSI